MNPIDPEPLLRRFSDAGVRHIVVGGFAVNAHGYIRPTKDLDIVPDPEPGNLARLSALLTAIEASHVGLGDFSPDEFPFDPTDPAQLAEGANFRLETPMGDLDIMQWISGIDAEPVYAELDREAIEGELDGIPIRVCGLRHLRAMKEAAGRPRDLDDLAHLPEG